MVVPVLKIEFTNELKIEFTNELGCEMKFFVEKLSFKYGVGELSNQTILALETVA
jgi:hypothetical protein